MELDEELQKSIDSLRWKIDTFFVVAIVLAVAALGIYISHLIFSSEINDFFDGDGTDIVNGITVLLASLSGVLFVYIAFLGQQWQLIYQQQEIRDNRTEMKASTAELKIQAKALTEQINKMDRDFVHQNFFRILDQHFKIRNEANLLHEHNYRTEEGGFFNTYGGMGELAFDGYFKKLILWVDNEKGWERKMDIHKEDKFRRENGYFWVPKRPDLGQIGDLSNMQFVQGYGPEKELNKKELAFVIRAVFSESEFGPYLRSCYFLFGFMQKNNLVEYLDAVEAGMNKFERCFLFYQIVTRFEIDEKHEIMDWLVKNGFLKNISAKHLLSPDHKDFLYPFFDSPDFKNLKFRNPHP